MIDSTGQPNQRSGLYRHVVAGISIGPMGGIPDTIQAVLTVAARPGHVADSIPHRHIPLSYQNMDLGDLYKASIWVHQQTGGERTVLIRSERGRQRPALVAAMCVLNMGGYYADALSCIRSADPNALTDFRYLNILREEDALARRVGLRP